MDDIIRNWFSDRDITPLNIITVCIIITEESRLITSKIFHCKSLYSEIVNILLTDGKIDNDIKEDLLLKYETLLTEGTIDDFIKIICDITNDPNLINDKWISDNTTGRIKNKCFPCRSKANRK